MWNGRAPTPGGILETGVGFLDSSFDATTCCGAALGETCRSGTGGLYSALPCSCPFWPGKFDAFGSGCLAACQDGFEQTFLQGGKLLSGCWRKFEGRKLLV